MLNEDYRDMLRALSDEKVEFLLVGAYAMAVHGYPRATLDMDVWIMPSPGNVQATMRALARFGTPLEGLAPENLTRDGTVFQVGVAPRRIDILTSASGLEFSRAFEQSVLLDIGGTHVHVLSIPDLIKNKRASGRTKDLADAEALETLQHRPES